LILQYHVELMTCPDFDWSTLQPEREKHLRVNDRELARPNDVEHAQHSELAGSVNNRVLTERSNADVHCLT
jgi:hypothetical protein